jgi:hypothetical protein
MPRLVRDEALADRRHVVVLLRLVARADGRLVYGELIDVETGAKKRFADWGGQTRLARALLAEAVKRRDDSPTDRRSDTEEASS